MNINILGTKVHVLLVFVGALCVLLLFGCIGVISWGGWKMNQQDEATKKHSGETADLKNLTEHLNTENEKSQKETEKLSKNVENLNVKLQNKTEKLSSQLENLNEKSQKETKNLNQTIQLIQKFKAFLFNEHCNDKECLLCQRDWIFFSDSCYFISDVSLTWDQSRAFCQLKSADLIVIDNQQEQEFIYGNINTNTNYWLGLQRDAGSGSDWVWIDGRNNTLEFWNPSDYYYYNDDSYAFMYRTGDPTASWFSASNTDSYSFPPLCEQKAFKVSLN